MILYSPWYVVIPSVFLFLSSQIHRAVMILSVLFTVSGFTLIFVANRDTRGLITLGVSSTTLTLPCWWIELYHCALLCSV